MSGDFMKIIKKILKFLNISVLTAQEEQEILRKIIKRIKESEL